MSTIMTIGTALSAAYKALSAVSDSPQLDAQLLLMHVLDVQRTTLLAYPERALSQAHAAIYDAAITKAANGVPIPHITGLRAFYQHDFFVTADVLIPRPETEHLVYSAIAWVQSQSLNGSGMTLFDVGTGSGAIAVTLAAALPNATVYASDTSKAALDVAQSNAENIGVSNLTFYQGNLLEAFPPEIQPDLIAANLPYIPTHELESLVVAQHEPTLALDGGLDGLVLVRELLAQAPERVPASFCMLLEIGDGQGQATCELCADVFPQADVQLQLDYAGHDRLVVVTR